MADVPAPEVYTVAEVARAAGVPESLVLSLLTRGEVRSVAARLPTGLSTAAALDTYISHDEAVRVVRALRSGTRVSVAEPAGPRFAASKSTGSSTAIPLVVSTSLHLLAALTLAALASIDFVDANESSEPLEAEADVPRLVFLAQPGTGGGGGGGGRRNPLPAPRAELAGPRSLSSPINARSLPPPLPRPAPPPPEPLAAKPLPPVQAPVVAERADARDREGELTSRVPDATSAGPGAGSGAGTGRGTGVGEGAGSGIEDGEGGGAGGGPYRPGSGVAPPRLLQEVRASYTDAARRANVSGEVLLEIVVRRDGRVGEVRIVRGLGYGLDAKAIDAVRQWRFAPADLRGTPVDVLVEVAVQFTLR